MVLRLERSHAFVEWRSFSGGSRIGQEAADLYGSTESPGIDRRNKLPLLPLNPCATIPRVLLAEPRLDRAPHVLQMTRRRGGKLPGRSTPSALELPSPLGIPMATNPPIDDLPLAQRVDKSPHEYHMPNSPLPPEPPSA